MPDTASDLMPKLLVAGRELSAAPIMFHSAVAQQAGLSATEHKAVDMLLRNGPSTAGDHAGLIGLSTGAVTGLIDRLEAMKFVRRVPHPTDRRTVLNEPIEEQLGEIIGLKGIFPSLHRPQDVVALRSERRPLTRERGLHYSVGRCTTSH
jgi:DNA-binding MarR family transcriptional regulator